MLTDHLTSPSGRSMIAVVVAACLLSVGPGPTALAEGGGASSTEGARGAAPDRTAAAAAIVPGSLIVTHAAGERASSLLDRVPAGVRRGLGRARASALADGVSQLVVPPAEADAARAALLATPGVLAVEPDRVLSYASTGTAEAPDDPRFDEQWSHTLTDVRGGWAFATGSTGRRIAVIDSGIDRSHPDLTGVVAEQWAVSEGGVHAGSAPPCTGTVRQDDHPAYHHGTWVAGVAAAQGDNAEGVAGVAWRATVIDYQIATQGDCEPTDAKVIRALDHLTRRAAGDASLRVDVANLSLGGPQPSGICPTGLQRAIDGARAVGTVVVAAAGNDGGAAFQAPAGCRGVISVGGLTSVGSRASYSSMGAYLDLAAPGGEGGEGVLTTSRGGGYTAITGTSFAAPYVAGTVLLMQELRRQRGERLLTPEEVEGTLEAAAVHPMGRRQHDERVGWGRLRVGATLLAIRDARISLPRAARVSAATGQTEPVGQSVAVSRRTFDDAGAAWAVIGRADDFPDALAGSALGWGVAPLLFAPSQGSLPSAVARELRRVLPATGCRYGGTTQRCRVYLLGGPVALDPRLEAEIEAMGFAARRLEGETREHTAVAIAREVRSVLGSHASPEVILATRGNWPDAVAAGSMASIWGIPVLLTEPDRLHPQTAEYLRQHAGQIRHLYVVGGELVISDATARAAAEAAGLPAPERLGGAARDATAVTVATEVEARLAAAGDLPDYAIAIDLDRHDGYAHALSASVIAGRAFSVFVPVRSSQAPRQLTAVAAEYACGLPAEPLLAGDLDLLPDALGAQLRAVLHGDPARC